MERFQRVIEEAQKSFFLFGARGTGKSTWLKQRFSDAKWVDLLDEGLYQSYLARPEEFAQLIEATPTKQTIVIDEIQRLPNLLNEVHRFIERDQRRFILCGSSARKLKRAGVNLLAGRATRRHMYPFLPEELANDFNLEKVLRFGSIPLIWQSEDQKEALEDYAQMYLREEIQAEAIVRNLPAFARFLPVAALMHGQVLSISSLARDVGAHRNTVASYIEVLEDTLLAFRLPAYQANLRVKEKKHPKFYFIDPGIVRALKKNLYPVTQEERGSLFEGWFINYIKAIGEYKKLFDEIAYWSPTNTKFEVDLLIRRGKEMIAIEIKSSSRLRKEDFYGLEAIAKLKGLKHRILIYNGNEIRKKDHIDIIPIDQFIDQSIVEKL